MPKKKDSGSVKDVSSYISSLKKRFGDGAATQYDDINAVPKIERWDALSPKLNDMFGGGIPKGRIIEIYGPESSGKSSLSTFLSAQIQKQGGVVHYIDAEHAFDPSYAEMIGFSMKDAIFSQPNSGEEALNIAQAAAESGVVDFVVIDSVAALTPQAEIDGEIGDAHVGLQARMMSQALRKITSIAANNGTTLIFINQIRMKIGVMFGNPETTPGGKALKFYSSVRLDVRRRETLMDGETPKGIIIKIKGVKNKVGIPFKVTEVELDFAKGFQIEKEYVDFAVAFGIIEKSGAWYTLPGSDSKIQGTEKVLDALRTDSDLFEKIKRMVTQSLIKGFVDEEQPEEAPTRKKVEGKETAEEKEETIPDMEYGDIEEDLDDVDDIPDEDDIEVL